MNEDDFIRQTQGPEATPDYPFLPSEETYYYEPIIEEPSQALFSEPDDDCKSISTPPSTGVYSDLSSSETIESEHYCFLDDEQSSQSELNPLPNSDFAQYLTDPENIFSFRGLGLERDSSPFETETAIKQPQRDGKKRSRPFESDAPKSKRPPPLLEKSSTNKENTENRYFVASKTPRRGICTVTPASPEKELYGETPLYYGPGQTTKVRIIAKSLSGLSLFKPVTPKKTDKTGFQSPHQIVLKPKKEISEHLKLFSTNFSIKVTRDSLAKRHHESRNSTQEFLKGSCAHLHVQLHTDKDDDIQPREANAYQWGHILAFSLGGEHDKENIIGCTTEANRLTRSLVEDPVRHLLTSRETDEVTLEAKLYYKPNFYIPDIIKYTYSWVDKKTQKFHQEKRYINPRSTTLHDEEMKKAFDELVQAIEKLELKEELNNEELPLLARKLF